MPNYAGKNVGLIGNNCENYIIITGSKVRLCLIKPLLSLVMSIANNYSNKYFRLAYSIRCL